jgi:hypothetical protein
MPTTTCSRDYGIIEMPSKIHVTLTESALTNANLLKSIVSKIVEATDMSDINQKRLERYGILSGIVDDKKIEVVRSIDGVASVDADTRKFASGHSIGAK